MSVDQFVAIVTEDQPAAPAYFAHDADLNRRERPLLDEGPLPTLTLATLDEAVAAGAVVLDTRPTDEFARGHVAGSLNVGLGGRFAEQAGSVVPVGAKVVLIGEPEALDEARVRLARIGFDDVVGALTDIEAVLAERPDRASRLSRLTAAELAERRAELGAELQFVDVRNPGEVASLPVAGARNIPLADLRASLDELDRSRPIVLMCAGGTRSAIASSVLLSAGCADVSDVLGGANAVTGAATACSLTS
jgi:rhodanese-related sulfurtransferase